MSTPLPPLADPTRSRGLPAVVLVHYGAPGLTRRCLANLASVETEPHRVVVVDHGPGDGLGDALAGAHPRCLVLPNLANPGFGAGCNLGAALAFRDGAEAVWFLNNDATLEGPALGRLLALVRQCPGVGLWGTWQLDRGQERGIDLQGPWFARGLRVAPVALPDGCRQLQARESLGGASILVGRAQWQRLGPWPEDLFLYLEDAAWCRRAQGSGMALAMADVTVRHDRSGTIGRRSPLSIFYGVRNTLRLHREWHPGSRLERLGMALHMLQKRVFQGRFGLLGHTWRGIRAGMRGEAGRNPRY